MNLYVGSTNPVKVNASQTVLHQLFKDTDLTVKGVSADSNVSAQPMSEQETRLGALNRVAFLRKQEYVASTDWCIAIEGGVDNFLDGPATFAYVVINRNNTQAVGRSANLPLPEDFYKQLLAGKELGDVMDTAFGTDNVKQKGGAIGLLTQNNATRQSVYEVALTLAIAKFRFPELY